MPRLVLLSGLVLLGCGSPREHFDAASLPDGAEACTTDDECVLAVDRTDCCLCTRGYTSARVTADPCVYLPSEPAPEGCAPDPSSCDGTACRCGLALRVACQSGACVALDTCAMGEVQVGGRCMPACAAHTECVLAADYGSCCGGCDAVHTATDASDRCLATSASESECAPPAGSCDGLGCPSPPLDCMMFGNAVCMLDGSCAPGDGVGCPAGSHEMDGRCAPD